MKYRLLTFCLRLLSYLPLPASRFLGVLLGRACWYTSSAMARTTLTNLQLCFPQLSVSELRKLGRQSVEHTMQTIMESGAVWLWPGAKSLALIQQVENLNLVQDAKARGRGVIVLAPHLGNWELLGLYLNDCGLGQTYQLYQAPDNQHLNELIFKARSRAGATMVATDKKGVAELLRALRQGAVAGILPDQVPPRESGEYSDFFGVNALTMTLVVRLIQKTGAEAVFAYAKRIPSAAGAGFQIVFRRPDPKIYAQDMSTALAAMNRSIEALVKEAPEQYQWEYKRFKRQPTGAARFYDS